MREFLFLNLITRCCDAVMDRSLMEVKFYLNYSRDKIIILLRHSTSIAIYKLSISHIIFYGVSII